MRFCKLRLISENQQGFTLVELLIAISISSIMAIGAIIGISQIFNGSARTSNHTEAINQVQNAGYWFTHDAQMAQEVDLSEDEGAFPVNLTWTEWDGTTNVVTYVIVDNNLTRVLYQDGVNIGNMVVTPILDPDRTSCVWDDDGGTLIFTVTVTSGNDSQTINEIREYKVTPRPYIQ